MKRLEFPDAWYADALPSGEFAVLFQTRHMETHLGQIRLPAGDEPLYHRITNVGGFKIAGQGHFAGRTWLWKGEWQPAPPACGVSPVIFGNDGRLTISDCSVGSQGYRYVAPDGRLVSGDETYGVRHGLNEWTDLSSIQDGSLLIGQEHDGAGAVLWDGSQLRMVEPGACRFIRAYKEGERVSVATWKEGFGAVILWLTVAELLALPLFIKSEQPPVIEQPPQPKPEPQPVTPVTPNRLDIAEQVAAEHPELVRLNTSEACGKLVEHIAVTLHSVDPGFGLLSKQPGEHQYNGHAIDAIIYKPTQQVIDLMSGAGDRDLGSGVPPYQQFDIRLKWQEVGKRAGNDWMMPAITDVPEPVTPPPAVPDAVPDLVRRLDAIETTIGGLAAAVSALVTALANEMKYLEFSDTEKQFIGNTVNQIVTAIKTQRFKGSNRFLGAITLDPLP